MPGKGKGEKRKCIMREIVRKEEHRRDKRRKKGG